MDLHGFASSFLCIPRDCKVTVLAQPVCRDPALSMWAYTASSLSVCSCPCVTPPLVLTQLFVRTALKTYVNWFELKLLFICLFIWPSNWLGLYSWGGGEAWGSRWAEVKARCCLLAGAAAHSESFSPLKSHILMALQSRCITGLVQSKLFWIMREFFYSMCSEFIVLHSRINQENSSVKVGHLLITD